MTIEVTQEDINEGCRYQAANCPLARALARCFPDALKTTVYKRLHVCYADKTLWADTPDHVFKWIQAFDRQEHVVPFSFDVTFQEVAIDADND